MLLFCLDKMAQKLQKYNENPNSQVENLTITERLKIKGKNEDGLNRKT